MKACIPHYPNSGGYHGKNYLLGGQIKDVSAVSLGLEESDQ